VSGVLVLALLIPLAMVRSLVQERQSRRASVVQDVGASWGGSQVVGGPALVVPYVARTSDGQGKVTTTEQYAIFLPDILHADVKLAPEVRNRGIFEAVLYRADLHVSGTFRRPDWSGWPVAPEDVRWEAATLALGVTDMRGIRGASAVHWGAADQPFSPGSGSTGMWASELTAPAPGLRTLADNGTVDFQIDLGINGSGEIRFLPLGKETVATATSPWHNPSFSGSFPPETRHVRADGFDAAWRISYFGRSYPQRWRRCEGQQAELNSAVTESSFGVGLFLAADSYQKTERSMKYGILFLTLTFLTYFLFEIFSAVSLHPLQYLLVGAALCLFYLLLLSISEQVAFGRAYAVAAVATVFLIAAYSSAILGGLRRSLILAAILGGLYGYLYVLLQAEDYALLLGTIGLFVVLAVVMYITRRIDWSKGPVASPPMG
jgi:inner membrane protein